VASAGEKVLESRSVYQGRKVHLRVDTVALPGGRTALREIVSVPQAAVIVPLTEDGRVYLVRQYRAAIASYLLELPAGTLNPGEEPLACARRELAEEIGRQAGDWQLITSFYSMPGICDEVLHLFLARRLTPAESHPDLDEFIEVMTLPLDEAVALARSGQLRDAKSIIGLLLAAGR
jgi:ADP-ribose pyrophosphatase